MKTNNQPAIGQPAKPCLSVWKPRKLWLAAGIGMGVGVLGGSAYLLLGGPEFYVIAPRWAGVIFYTGFAVGEKASVSGLSEGAAKVVGVITVGLTYALIAVLARLAWRLVKRKD